MMTLKEASEVLFGTRSKVSALRSQIHKGNLTASLIANTHYVTISALREMQIKCQEKNNHLDSTGTQKTQRGSSETEKFSSEQDLVRNKLNSLKKNLRNTSQENGNHNQKESGQVISIAARS